MHTMRLTAMTINVTVLTCSLLPATQAAAQSSPFANWKGYPAGYQAPVGSGPYPAVMETDPSLPTHTIYRPKDLDPFVGIRRLPIVAFGNGACANIGSLYRIFLTELASQGFLVIAIGPIGADMSEMSMPPPPPANASAPGARPKLPPVESKSSQLIDAVDWALKQEGEPHSKLGGKLSIHKIALMGHSCGGIQALEMSSDPRVGTTVVLNSGLFAGPSPIEGLDVPETHLQNLHAPVIYLIGGPSDVAYQPAEHNFPTIKVPVFKGNLDVGHRATYVQSNGGVFGKVVGDWLKWQLLGDHVAGTQFAGKNCGLCIDSKWQIERKGID
jgi:hypothetical protein